MPKLEIWWCAKEEVLPGSAAFGLAYTCAHAWWVDDTTVVNAVVGWTATRYYVFVLCRALGKISLGIDTHWAVWHAAGHAFESVGCYALAVGEVEGRFRWSWSMWPQNRWAEAWCVACRARNARDRLHCNPPERVSSANSSLLPPPLMNQCCSRPRCPRVRLCNCCSDPQGSKKELRSNNTSTEDQKPKWRVPACM